MLWERDCTGGLLFKAVGQAPDPSPVRAACMRGRTCAPPPLARSHRQAHCCWPSAVPGTLSRLKQIALPPDTATANCWAWQPQGLGRSPDSVTAGPLTGTSSGRSPSICVFWPKSWGGPRDCQAVAGAQQPCPAGPAWLCAWGFCPGARVAWRCRRLRAIRFLQPPPLWCAD